MVVENGDENTESLSGWLEQVETGVSTLPGRPHFIFALKYLPSLRLHLVKGDGRCSWKRSIDAGEG
jgi:hypothetical protein